ncbi:MAG: esterase family protein [Muribaculaceae bacterium]|nr:esterase family protein [Muribaculaceae bacterium]
MHRDINNIVVVPKAYLEPNDTTRYPTLYLLHGATDDYTGWSKHTDFGEIADTRRLIIVCPDGQDSWYFDSPIDSTMQFETYVSKELVDFIDKNYRTFANRQMRAITGLSMGGHGALWIAWRHPDVFASCGSMSGGVDITKFPDRWQLHKRLGRYAANKKVWEEHSVANLVPTLKEGQNIIISVGRQDFFYNVNLALHDSLTKRNIIHTFKTGKGNHSWDYWVKTLKDHLKFFDIAFEKNYTTQQQ